MPILRLFVHPARKQKKSLNCNPFASILRFGSAAFLGGRIEFKMYFHDWLWVARQHNINNCVLAFYAIKIPLHTSTPSTKLDCFQNSKVWVFIAQPLQGRTTNVLISKTEMRILLWKCFNHYCVHYCFKEVECKKINEALFYALRKMLTKL